MNIELDDHSGRRRTRTLAAILIVLLAVIALAEIVRAWSASSADQLQLGHLDSAARHELCSVLLVNGQMYYGILEEARGGMVKLSDVYYVRSNSQQSGGQALNELTSRRKADWHSPDWMAIPVDKILFVERVGSKSQVALLIAKDHGSAPTP